MRIFASIALLICLTSATTLCAQEDWTFPETAPATTIAPVTPPAPLPVPPTPPVVVADPIPAEAKVVLDAPSSCRIGELVRLDASESVADSFKWLLIPDSDDFLVYDDGRRAVFSARAPGEFRFVLAVAKGGSIDVITHLIRVIGPPDEPESDDFVELIPFWNWTLDLPEDELAAIADNFASLAARDDLVTPEQWIKETVESNRAILGDRIEAWAPLLDQIGKMLVEKAQSGALVTPEDHKREWERIAEGLKSC